MKKIISNRHISAVSLLEILVAIAFLAVLLTGAIGVFQLALRTVEQSQNYTYAELVASDLIELTTSKRNEDWNSLVSGQYHFAQDPLLGILFVAGTQQDGIFTKSVNISDVYRDGNGAITQSGGTLDADTKRVQALVTWTFRETAYEVELVQYLTNWKRF